MLASAQWYERCKRMRNMSWAELCVRARQEVAKRTDLALCRSGRNLIRDGYSSHAKSSGHFFFSSEGVPGILAWLREHLPTSVEGIIDQAEQICQHRFDLLGYEGLDYGPEIDWHLDAVNRKRSPRRPWFQVHYLDFREVGDSKVIWELNRHQHLVTLAKAYRLTEQRRYAVEIFRQWWH